jgi:hypothetical protein
MKLIHRQLLQVAGVAVVNAPSWGAEPNVVGNWKIVSLFDEELATGNKTTPLGEHPKGYHIYTPEGRMMTWSCTRHAVPPARSRLERGS